jgi:hypothetical protein
MLSLANSEILMRSEIVLAVVVRVVSHRTTEPRLKRIYARFPNPAFASEGPRRGLLSNKKAGPSKRIRPDGTRKSLAL